ncbi:hypothetical protein BOX15_Mlig003398g1 [Macrostomum lignano]|uniref:Pacifastin domain-containing protein n=1 Tax=Macrostomum lignano TaxID=282301 RepID=A0A267F8N7_9PLAT|nr:hypothetical protein BOX15_Mlig003398g1 [Macrostomum lignano]
MQLLFLITVGLLCTAVSSSQAEKDEPALRCPDLDPGLVCNATESGFSYNDGCNTVTCNDGGLASTTLLACPEPSSRGERNLCESLSRAVWSRLGPFTCYNIDADSVCTRRGAGFAFSDGCNRVRCLAAGGHARTRMECPVTDPTGPYCRFVALALESEGSEKQQSEEPRAGALEEDEFECPALRHSRICEEFLPGFQYNDGCRNVTCVSDGLARVADSRECPQPEPDNEAAALYCREAQRRFQEKKDRSRFYTTCLDADSLCRGRRTAELAFFDGCNRCFCLPDRSAACTRAACPPMFITPEEFTAHCRRVGAGVLSHRRRK